MADTTHFVAPFVDELVREGYFAPWNTQAGAPGTAPVKIGVLYAVDRPDLLSLYQSALARYGMHVSDSFYLQSSSDSGQLAGAMLRFKADHITHVLSDGFLSVVPTVAENAGYRPRYGVSSWDGFQVAVGAGPSAQFHGAVGVGWTPLEDLDAQHDRTKNRALTDCLSIMANAGQSTTTRSTEVSMASVCEQLLLLATSLRQATSLTPLSVQAGIESLGTGFPSPLTLGERFGPGRHAGVAAFSPVHYDVSCGCFTYFGSPQTFP
jgi:hypothetical protein